MEGDLEINCTLTDAEGKEIGRAVSNGENIAIPVAAPVLWNAEQPYLYTLTLQAGAETIEQKVGIRTISVEDGKILINGKQVKFRGVNRHDSNPYTGAAVTREDAVSYTHLDVYKRQGYGIEKCGVRRENYV